MRTEKNILLHELMGLQCEIVGAENKSQVGLRGRIVDETMKTIVLEGKDNREIIIPKKGTKFQVQLGKKSAVITGDFIVARPEDRIKKRIRKW